MYSVFRSIHSTFEFISLNRTQWMQKALLTWKWKKKMRLEKMFGNAKWNTIFPICVAATCKLHNILRRQNELISKTSYALESTMRSSFAFPHYFPLCSASAGTFERRFAASLLMRQIREEKSRVLHSFRFVCYQLNVSPHKLLDSLLPSLHSHFETVRFVLATSVWLTEYMMRIIKTITFLLFLLFHV